MPSPPQYNAPRSELPPLVSRLTDIEPGR